MFNEQEIENSEFASLLKYAECGVCAYQIETGKTPVMMYMTDGFCNICEGDKEEIQQAYKTNRLFGVHPDYHEAMNHTIADAIMKNEKQEITYRAVSLKGSLKWCMLKINPEKRKNGITMLYGTFFDVTSQMNTQNHMSDLIHNVPGAVCMYHYNGTYLEPMIVSDRYSEMLGTDAFAVLKNMKDLNFKHVHPDDLENVKEQVLYALKESDKLDYTYRSYNEKLEKYLWINVQGKVVKAEEGDSYAYVIYTDITRDKEIEQKLYTNEQILEAATGQAGVWYWNCDWRNNIAYLGERFQKDFSLPAKVNGFCDSMFQYKIVDEGFRTLFFDMCQKIQSGEREAQVVVKGHLPDGTSHWMEFKLNNVFDEKGNAQEAIGVFRLVDDIKDMERKYEIEKRHAMEDKNLLAHGCFNLSNWEIIDYAGTYLFQQNSEHLTLGIIGENIAREAIDDKVKQEILKIHDAAFLIEEFAEGNKEYSLEYQRTLKTGECIWVRTTMHLMHEQYGTDLLVFEYCYDISHQKALNILTEYAVNDDYDMLGLVNIRDEKAIMIYGRNSYNPYHEAVCEEDYDRSMLRFAENAVSAADRDRYIEMACIKNVRAWLEQHDDLEFYFQTKDENGNIHSKKVRYVKYAKDENSYIFIQSDITQLVAEQEKSRLALEKALESARVASSAKTSFLSQMSHEIRTPMNAIIGMTQLAKQADNELEIMQYLNQIDSSSQFLLGIINDILDMSRIESGKLELHPQWVDGCKIVRDCIAMLNPAMEKKKIHFIYPEGIQNKSVLFYEDPLRIQQIYMNLLNNAVKFTHEGGTIELSIHNIYYDKQHGRDRIQIRDTGCGMSAEFLTRIFHPFEMEENEFSSTVQGTGLGLALVKSYITQMGGDIWVESELGKGSTFIFEIPYEMKYAGDAVEIEEKIEPASSLENTHVLLADDHPLNREIARKLLEHVGVKVTTAVDGKDVCEKFQESETGLYDAILMDIRMPIMDGLEATRMIRKMNRSDGKTIPIIAMTANAFDEDVEKSLQAGMNAHLAKPIEPNKLMKTLRKYIGLK